MRVEEVEVWITCDGHQLAEFGAEPSRSSPRTLACYIPSEAGKTFAFNWKSTMTLPSGVYLRYDFTIDGSSAGAQWSYQWEKPGSRWGVRTCLTLRRPFTFAPLTTTDDDAVCNDTEAMDLGTIQVRVWRGRSKPIADPTGSAEYIAFTPTSIVHERSKKAGVHCVTLGSGTEVEPRGARWTSEILNREDGPIATFIFRYRPLGLLQAQGIAPLPEQPVESSKRLRQADSPLPGPPTQAKCPRTGSPIPVMTGNADVKPDISELSDGDDDLDALNTQLSQIQDRINRAKAKKGRSSPAATKVKKEEPKTSARDALDGDVIDLTMSD